MFDAILKAANSSFQKGMTFCLSIYIKKAMEQIALIFEHPSYNYLNCLMFQRAQTHVLTRQSTRFLVDEYTRS